MRLFIICLAFSLIFINQSVSQSSLAGKVFDLDSQEPMAFAQVALMVPADSSLVTGSTTYIDGGFEIHTETQGPHLLRVSYVGFDDHWPAPQCHEQPGYGKFKRK